MQSTNNSQWDFRKPEVCLTETSSQVDNLSTKPNREFQTQPHEVHRTLLFSVVTRSRKKHKLSLVFLRLDRTEDPDRRQEDMTLTCTILGNAGGALELKGTLSRPLGPAGELIVQVPCCCLKMVLPPLKPSSFPAWSECVAFSLGLDQIPWKRLDWLFAIVTIISAATGL